MRSPIVTAVHETRSIPRRPLGRSSTLLLLLGLVGLPAVGAAGTGRLLSQWMNRAPRIDGQIEAGEWGAAKLVDLGDGVTVRLGNDARKLYVAVLDSGDLTYGGGDSLVLRFDDEGGVPPVLDDGAFGGANCEQAPTLGEGMFEFRLDQTVGYLEFAGGWCPPQPVTDRTSFRSAARPQGVTYEAAIPLDGSGPLRASPGERFALSLLVYSGETRLSCLPTCGSTVPNFRNLVLASGGCNSGPQTFGAGDPRTSLPLDWSGELTAGSGRGWVQTLPPLYGDPVFCHANDTGGFGAAACVANALDATPRTDSRLVMPLSLVGQTSAMVRFRAVLTVDPNGHGPYEYLSVDLRRQDGTTGNTSLFWLGQDHRADVVLLLPVGANPAVELWFTHSTFSGGGVEGGYAQIDDVELLCDPLHTDDFEGGDGARWSAAGP